MNTGNWKTATSSRDRKKRGADKPTPSKAGKDNAKEKTAHNVEAILPKSHPELSKSHLDPKSSNPFDAISGTSGEPLIVTHILTRAEWDAHCESNPIEIVVNTESTQPMLSHIPEKTSVKQPTKAKWGDQSEDEPTMPNAKTDDRFEPLIRIFSADLKGACGSFDAELEYVTGFANAILKMGIKLIENKKQDIEKFHDSEKELVNDLHDICTYGKELVNKVEDSVKSITAIVNECETKKNTTLDELKNFLLGMTNAKPSNPETKANAIVKRASDLFSQERGKYSTVVARSDPTSSKNVDVASVPLGMANLVVPLVRQRTDLPPLSIKFAADLGVFLINLDGKTYSFCNGVFVSRPSKTNDPKLRVAGDNTLYGKRCNPGVALCVGPECTYYHDPLSHANGHTSRNMGVHYVVSELISGVSTDADIIETACGRNKYVVEDIVQLAGMLLIKAFLVKKVREDRASRDSGDA